MKLEKTIIRDLANKFVQKLEGKEAKLLMLSLAHHSTFIYFMLHTEAGDGGGVVVDGNIVVEAAGALLQAEGQPAQPEYVTWSSSYNPPKQTSNFLT